MTCVVESGGGGEEMMFIETLVKGLHNRLYRLAYLLAKIGIESRQVDIRAINNNCRRDGRCLRVFICGCDDNQLAHRSNYDEIYSLALKLPVTLAVLPT